MCKLINIPQNANVGSFVGYFYMWKLKFKYLKIKVLKTIFAFVPIRF
jgi:hypothetical protein